MGKVEAVNQLVPKKSQKRDAILREQGGSNMSVVHSKENGHAVEKEERCGNFL